MRAPRRFRMGLVKVFFFQGVEERLHVLVREAVVIATLDQFEHQAGGRVALESRPFALHHLDDQRRRHQDTRLGIGKQAVDVVQAGIDPCLSAQAEGATVVVGVRQEVHVRRQ